MISKNYRRQIMRLQKTVFFDRDNHEINENRLNGGTTIMDDPHEWKEHSIEDPQRHSHPHLCISEKYGVLTISVSVEEPEDHSDSDMQL
jgi:hypothetical protein